MTLRVSDLTVGQSFSATVVDVLTRTQIVRYAGASGDFNPIHHDELFAKAAGFDSVFAHGMLTMGMTGKVLTDLVGPDRILSYGGRFTAQVWPGDSLVATLTVTDVAIADADGLVEFAIRTTNQNGTEVFSGTARARLDA